MIDQKTQFPLCQNMGPVKRKGHTPLPPPPPPLKKEAWRVKLNKLACGITLKHMQWITAGVSHTRLGTDSLPVID